MAVYMPNAPTGTGERLVILGIAEDSPVTGPECHSPGQGDAGHSPGGPGQCRERRSRPVREWERYRPSMSDIDERVLDALALDWRKLSILPSGETEEVSLASVRELAQYLSVTESTIRRFEAAPEAPRPH